MEDSAAGTAAAGELPDRGLQGTSRSRSAMHSPQPDAPEHRIEHHLDGDHRPVRDRCRDRIGGPRVALDQLADEFADANPVDEA